MAVCPHQGPVFEKFSKLPLIACYREKMGMAAGRFRGLGTFSLRSRFQPTTEILKRMKDRHGCDIAICQYPKEQILTAEIGKELGYASVWIIHSQLHCFLHRRFLIARWRRAMPLAATVLVVSRATRNSLVAEGFPEECMRAVNVGIRPPTLLPTRSDTQPRIGVLSRLSFQKGVQDVLTAAAKLVHSYPNSRSSSPVPEDMNKL